MYYITGDTHGSFSRIESFCSRMQTNTEDTMIILGDAGLNFHGDWRDIMRKQSVSRLPITLFCIHGNHEKRPGNIPSYQEKLWNSGKVYYEPQYPNILFAQDGEIYRFGSIHAIVIGGAYSIDKAFRTEGKDWWCDEQPSAEIKEFVETRLNSVDWKVDLVLSHTAPLMYEPVEVFLPGLDQSTVDKSTEEWLGRIEAKLDYKKWYFAHYHTSKKIDKIQIMYNDIDTL